MNVAYLLNNMPNWDLVEYVYHETWVPPKPAAKIHSLYNREFSTTLLESLVYEDVWKPWIKRLINLK